MTLNTEKTCSASAGGNVAGIFDKLSKIVSAELVKQTDAVYAFKLAGVLINKERKDAVCV